MSHQRIVAGVDVGGSRKGFHAVTLREGEYLDHYEATEAAKIADWCRKQGAVLIGVDAPCRWSRTGRARECERQLMEEEIWCFSTPTRAAAERHPTGNFDWMLNGEALFRALQKTHTLFDGRLEPANRSLCFETFPHAVTWALAGKPVLAKNKRTKRPELLRQAGVATENLKGIDRIDAALCALTAHYLALGAIETYGDESEGLIVVPDKPLARK